MKVDRFDSLLDLDHWLKYTGGPNNTYDMNHIP